MDFHLVTFLAVLLVLAVSLADLIIDLRHAIPRKRRAEQRADAARAVRAAKQEPHLQGRSNEERALYAAAFLLDLHPGMKPATARRLVEDAVGESKVGA